MPSITTVHESLPYIDPEPTPSARAAAEALIAAERALVPDDPFHALLPPAHNPNYTPLLASELARVTQDPGSSRLSALDFSRYEEPADAAELRGLSASEAQATLARAHASHAYVAARRAHLALLDGELGRNAWLIGNWQLEGELKALERELAEARRELDLVALRRRTAQEEVAGEMRGLEEIWKRGVARVLETEVAVEGLRRQVLEARRGG